MHWKPSVGIFKGKGLIVNIMNIKTEIMGYSKYQTEFKLPGSNCIYYFSFEVLQIRVLQVRVLQIQSTPVQSSNTECLSNSPMGREDQISSKFFILPSALFFCKYLVLK